MDTIEDYIEMLVAYGFSREIAKEAMEAVKELSIEKALDWIYDVKA